MESIITTFHIDWKIIVAQAINFGIVFAVLYFFALKPLNKLMAERSEKINRGVVDAKSNAELLVATKAEYEKVIQEARNGAQAIFQEGRKQADVKRAEMLETTKVEMQKMIENGKKTLEIEKSKMVEEAKREIISLTLESTKKILEKNEDELAKFK